MDGSAVSVAGTSVDSLRIERMQETARAIDNLISRMKKMARIASIQAESARSRQRSATQAWDWYNDPTV